MAQLDRNDRAYLVEILREQVKETRRGSVSWGSKEADEANIEWMGELIEKLDDGE